MTQLRAQVVPVDQIPAARRAAMYRLMCQYYDGMRRDTFEADLSGKDWVIQLCDTTGQVRGFSTQVVWHLPTAQGAVRVLFSGDTIVDHRYWSQNPLSQAWGRLALELIEGSHLPICWFLIVKGYKTYRFLPLFFHEFYPRHDVTMPPWADGLIDTLGRARFPGQFDPDRGIIRADDDGCRLRSGVADLTAERLRDEHVRYFAHRNPRHTAGDELCCIAPLSRENFTPAVRRVIGKHALAATVTT